MNKTLFTASLLLSLAGTALAQAPLKKHPDTTQKGWVSLFKPDLSDATKPEGVWTVQDGVLTASEDKPIWSEKQYENFIIDLEFKNAAGTNSGVFVYCSDRAQFVPNSVEIQIADDYADQWAKSPASWRCGAYFGHQPAQKTAVKKAGAWNRYTITCQGKNLSVLLNGELVNQIDLSRFTSATKNPDGTEVPKWLSKPGAESPTKGYVGFQGKHAGAPIYFRNIKIKEL